ncbi:baseplate J/gp47 family protein [Robertmurraya korlensis]|uniref:baseplate J/gp47 family protein n=1 Tax=Robertmurraya korlensis TaxID=519977 RepID=UPI00203A6649|nr:baseplate J/gp47 family protein [Robertmurraya korlensis]MCM3599400.1 baseplate J/gp47 family protein [Robertmurraya korlensis]
MPTKDEIIERMLSSISDDYDKSEGSFIYDAVVGVATALEDGYIEMDTIIDKAFAETATDEYLDKITAELGITRKPATYATTTVRVSGTNGTIIPVGTRFFVDTVYFTSTEEKTISSGIANVPVTCESAGSIGNVPANSIVNLEAIEGVTSVTNLSAVINGTDEETDDQLRERYFDKVQTPATSGNAQHYINWCREVIGIGDAKVIPLWNGNGTVKCLVINSNGLAADSTLVSTVQSHVDANKPIGATVTVQSATELVINVSVDVDILSGYSLVSVTTTITESLKEYLKSIAFKSTFVSYALVGSKILEVPGVSDYRNLTLNSGTANVTIGSSQVAVVGTVNVT